MELIQLTKDKYEDWNKFCLESNTAWFRHTTYFLEYAKNCRFDKKSKNLSFMVYQNNKIVAIVPLNLQTIYNTEIFEFAVGDTPMPYPAFCNELGEENKKKITRAIFKEIDKIAKENNVVYSRFFLDPLSIQILSGKQRFNPLPMFRYHETSLSTNIVYLDIPENQLFTNIREGHKRNIKASMKAGYMVDIFDQRNISEEIFNIYKELHFLAAGRKTRPDESWDNMFEFIKMGYAILALEKEQNSNKYFAGIFVIIFKQNAYYGSGATNPEYNRLKGVGHLLHWEIIKYLKANGCKYYELGWNYYQIISQEVYSQKELTISHFKSGFGGIIYPLFRGEKFYSKNYLLKIYSKRLNAFSLIFEEE